MSTHTLTSPFGEVHIDEQGAVFQGCQLGGVWVMPDTRTAPEFAAGQQLFPWPNRLRNGQWHDGEVLRQLECTEPARSNAIHGLLRTVRFDVTTNTDTLRLRGVLEPESGYPWQIGCEFGAQLSEGAFTFTAAFENQSERAAPWAYGSHPYLCLPGSAQFSLAADRVWMFDEQMIPTHSEAVAGEFDLHEPRRLGSFVLDHAFERTDRVLARLSTPEHELAMWADEHCPYVQVFTPPPGSSLHSTGTAVAVEPMTALADAFNNGLGLRWLNPGETATLSWGLTLTPLGA